MIAAGVCKDAGSIAADSTFFLRSEEGSYGLSGFRGRFSGSATRGMRQIRGQRTRDDRVHHCVRCRPQPRVPLLCSRKARLRNRRWSDRSSRMMLGDGKASAHPQAGSTGSANDKGGPPFPIRRPLSPSALTYNSAQDYPKSRGLRPTNNW